jgi:4-amino-4-deoxy-L-arabinose transferase-like glycosyltransferase
MIIPRNVSHMRVSPWTWVILICVVFVLIRLPGVDVPYYQDEWKNVHASASVSDAGKFFAHPPLMQIAFVGAYEMFGPDFFRVFPLIFSVGTILLVYMVMMRRGQSRAGIYAALLLGVCFYNILGALMPDVDGSMLPFFFVAAVYAYDRWGEEGSRKWYWFVLMVGMLMVGFLLKLSFIIVAGVLFCDYAWHHRKSLLYKKGIYLGGSFVAFVALYAVIVHLISRVYPAFDISIMFGHANQFAEGVGRNWIQIVVQGLKALFYLSPVLLVPLLFISKDIIQKSRIWITYLVLGGMFYFVIFDFSRGALDKYLMFAIVPLAMIVGMILSSLFEKDASTRSVRWGIGGGITLSLLLVASNFMPHEVLGLYPKTLWFSRVLHGDWFMLNPFNGGSGPMGFYVSFFFLASTFVVSVCLGIVGYIKKGLRPGVLIALCIIGLTYNAIMAEEYMYGRINGSAAEVLRDLIGNIENNPRIKEVITYNDIGARELSERSLYAGRFYAAPQFEEGHRAKFAAYHGHYMVVGIPPLYTGFYSEFFSRCDILSESQSGVIRGVVYTCP